MKKLLSVFLAIVSVLSLASCGCTPASKYVIGIASYHDHVSQAEVVKGFRDYLTEKLGSDVGFLESSASGDASTASLQINDFINRNVDLILADTTQALQTAASSTSTIPLLGAAITDYTSALGGDVMGMNVSGTSDLAPLDKQAEMILDLFPEAKTVGLLYCSSEANSLYQINAIQEYLQKKGISCYEYAFTDANDITFLAERACNECDVIYVPTDNTVAECAPIIRNIAGPAKIPVIAGEEGICSGCGVAALTIDYYELGRKTGEMAYRVLVEGEDITNMPVSVSDKITYKYNPEICKELGITPPADYLPIE